MLSKKQIKEIQEHLEKAQNPVFFFDNDTDGLCSFILLQRYIERGKGVAIKTFPDMTKDYFRKVKEFEADYIFILDKAVVSEAFFNEAEKYNIPIVWIDHHEVHDAVPESVNYYNPSDEPVTMFCYQVSQKKEDLWLALVGNIADRYLPDFYKEFQKNYPELSVEAKDAYDVRYKSQIGKVSRILEFALKDKTTNVVNMLKFLMKAKSPYDVLDEEARNYSMHKRFNELNKKYLVILRNAMIVGNSSGNVLSFKYSSETKFSQNLADELMYNFPDKLVIVAYVDGLKTTMSIRGEKIKDQVVKIIKSFSDATCGGHENSLGAKINTGNFEDFEKQVKELFG